MAHEFVIQPNRSLSDRGRRFLFCGIGLLMALITLRFMVLGGWMVLPFMLADLLVLLVAFAVARRKCEIVERVVIEEDQLTIHHEEEKHPRHWSFPLYWVNIDLRQGRYPSHGTRLLIGSHGRWVELAGFLTNSERESLSHAIRKAVLEARKISALS